MRIVAIIAAVAALGLAACGTTDEDSLPTPSATDLEIQAEFDRCVAPYEGRNDSASIKAYNACVAESNAAYEEASD